METHYQLQQTRIFEDVDLDATEQIARVFLEKSFSVYSEDHNPDHYFFFFYSRNTLYLYKITQRG